MNLQNSDEKHRIDLERKILGAIIISMDAKNGTLPKRMTSHSESVRDLVLRHGHIPEDFYYPIHRVIFASILKCWENDLPADLLVVSQMKPSVYNDPGVKDTNDIPFDFYVIQLTQMISSAAHLEFHMMILKQYLYKDYWNALSEYIFATQWDKVDIVEFSEKCILNFRALERRVTSRLKKTGGSAAEQFRERFEQGELANIMFGVQQIDDDTGGFYPGEFYVIAGRPGMGKTTVTLIIMMMAARLGKRIIFFSHEMTKLQLLTRIACNFLNYDYTLAKMRKLSNIEMTNIYYFIKNFEENSTLIIIDDCRQLDQMEAKIAELNPDGIVTDYIQLCELPESTSKFTNREQVVATISKRHKHWAKMFNIPTIGLAQLSRELEKRPIEKRRPMMSDLRESGQIEQDADVIIFYFRMAYYLMQNGQTVPKIEQGNLEMIFAKGRELDIDTFKVNIDFKRMILREGFKFPGDELEDVETFAPPPPPLGIEAPEEPPDPS